MDNHAPSARAAHRNGGTASTTRRGFLTTAIAATLVPLLPTPQRLNVTAEGLGIIYADGVHDPYAFLGGRIVPLFGDRDAPTPTEVKAIQAITAALLAGDHVNGPNTRALKAKLGAN